MIDERAYKSVAQHLERAAPILFHDTAFLPTGILLGFFSREIDQFQSRLERIGKEKNGSIRRWTY